MNKEKRHCSSYKFKTYERKQDISKKKWRHFHTKDRRLFPY